MSWKRLLRALLLLMFAASALSLPAQDGGGDKPRPNKKPPGELPGDPPRERGREPDLSPEENERLRQALAKAWEDPEVIRSRESVRQATEEYRKALRNAVRQVDPGAVDLMGKLHEKSKSQAIEHRIQPKNKAKGNPEFPPSPPSNASPVEMVQWIVDNEPGFRPLDSDRRRGLTRQAQDIVRTGALDPELAAVRASNNPKEGHNARMRLRQRLFDLMAEQDPGFRQLRASLPEPPAPRPNRPINEPRPERLPVEVER